MNEAITRAIIIGGYNPGTDSPDGNWSYNMRCVIALDPEFWKALGRALGWKGIVEFEMQENFRHESSLAINGGWDVWRYHAHNYLDIKLSNGDETAFWENLLKGK